MHKLPYCASVLLSSQLPYCAFVLLLATVAILFHAPTCLITDAILCLCRSRRCHTPIFFPLSVFYFICCFICFIDFFSYSCPSYMYLEGVVIYSCSSLYCCTTALSLVVDLKKKVVYCRVPGSSFCTVREKARTRVTSHVYWRITFSSLHAVLTVLMLKRPKWKQVI